MVARVSFGDLILKGEGMDLVYIRELEIWTIIGIYDWEREQKQLVSISLEGSVG